MNAPLPCPFCAGTKLAVFQDVIGHTVMCDNHDCPVNVAAEGKTAEEALEHWNRRAADRDGERFRWWLALWCADTDEAMDRLNDVLARPVALSPEGVRAAIDAAMKPAMVDCPSCIGSGKICEQGDTPQQDRWRRCMDCTGTGKVPAP